MEELEAVQMMLRAIGCSPVNSLNAAHPDIANARATLDRVRRSNQKRGWWFNTDYNVNFQANSVGEVTIPKEITKFVAADGALVKRGRKVYNQYSQTFKIGQTVLAIKTIRALEWADMPASMQEMAAYLACAQFIADELEDPAKEQKFTQLAGISKIDVDAEDLDSSRVNIFNNARVAKARSGQRPYQAGGSLRPNTYGG